MSVKTKGALGFVGCLLATAACGPAHAQSSVTLFGVVDVAMLYTNKTRDPVTGLNAGKQISMIDGGRYYSQFGLTGTEDLGGGIQAKFRLQSGISATSGELSHCNGNFFGCEAWVSLASSAGELKMGLQFSPFFLAVYDADPRSLSLFGSESIHYVGSVFATGVFNSNSVSYTSPTIAGFNVSALIAFGGKPGDFSAGRQYSASVRYHLGGLTLNAALYSGNAGGASSTPVPTNVEFNGRMLGVGYQFGSLTAKASFVNYKVAGSFDSNVYGGGIDWFVLPTLDINGGAWLTSDRNHTTNHSFLASIGTDYYLSKSTTLYAEIGMVNNHGAMNTGLSMVGALYEVSGTSFGGALGIRKYF
ncbi:porin [Burkholderia sp. Ac-20353]|uniref:porin n=1 Tax=Burkholderia sp. Ac-20353 TaxID=2703894 RepID=UPI00197B5DCE|nr:porin [Burkholderia sp. Ac-20353]MBN3789126.1 porin [Burkholderia sp. Ac-20353]